MRFIKWFVLAFILANFSISFAASRIYQIDLIVFSHVTTKALLSENWPADPTLPMLSKAITLKPEDAAAPNALYQILSTHRSKFNKEVGILKQQAGYHILVDTTWLQPAFSPKVSKWIHIEGGNSIQVNGMMKISRPYLFQVDADLVLTIPKADKITATQFVLKQTASLRANQIYYFDQPLFGAIIRITPLNETVNESDLT